MEKAVNILIDVSDSMKEKIAGRRKVDLALDILRQNIMPYLESDIFIGLQIARDCEVETEFEIGKNKENILRHISGNTYEPHGKKTLAGALEIVMKSLLTQDVFYRDIILLTDSSLQDEDMREIISRIRQNEIELNVISVHSGIHAAQTVGLSERLDRYHNSLEAMHQRFNEAVTEYQQKLESLKADISGVDEKSQKNIDEIKKYLSELQTRQSGIEPRLVEISKKQEQELVSLKENAGTVDDKINKDFDEINNRLGAIEARQTNISDNLRAVGYAVIIPILLVIIIFLYNNNKINRLERYHQDNIAQIESIRQEKIVKIESDIARMEQQNKEAVDGCRAREEELKELYLRLKDYVYSLDEKNVPTSDASPVPHPETVPVPRSEGN